jgi:valyl-tRNA synthetase
MNGVGPSASLEAPAATKPVNCWIIGEVVDTLTKLNQAFDDLRFDGMADAIYHFTWGTFCDWYVELVKGGFDEETRAVAGWAFDQILVMLHPFMPFVTEELWHGMGERPYDLILAQWPAPGAASDGNAKSNVEALINFVDGVRTLRAELNIPWTATLAPHVLAGEGDRVLLDLIEQEGAILGRMAKVGAPVAADAPPAGSAQIVVGGATVAFPLGQAIDLDAERARLAKAAEAAEKERDSLGARLANPAFAERAKPEAVAKARADHDTRAAEADRLRAALARLG